MDATMSADSRVCCDANIAIVQVTRSDSAPVNDLWRKWIVENWTVVAPALLRYEATNVIHRMANAMNWRARETLELLEAIFDLPIELHSDPNIHRRAIELSREYKLPATYDAHYLALAEFLNCEFFTLDAKLHSSVGSTLNWVRLVI